MMAFPTFIFARKDPLALRKVKRFLAACQGYLYVVEPGKKQVFSAGVAFTTTLATARAKN